MGSRCGKVSASLFVRGGRSAQSATGIARIDIGAWLIQTEAVGQPVGPHGRDRLKAEVGARSRGAHGVTRSPRSRRSPDRKLRSESPRATPATAADRTVPCPRLQ